MTLENAPYARRKHARLALLTGALTLTFILVAGELLVRMLAPPRPLPAPPPVDTIDPYRSNPYILRLRPWQYSFIPGSRYTQARSYYRVQYSINSLGFRGPEILPQEETGLKRLLVVGDSMVEGHGSEFEQTFVAHLNRRLREHGWEAVNVGVQGASPVYYAANLDRYLSLEPDAVLVLVFDNDLRDDRVTEATFFQAPWLDDPTALTADTGSNWAWPSRLYVLLRNSLHMLWPSPLERIVAAHREVRLTNAEQEALKEISDHLIAPSLFDRHWKMSEAYLNYLATGLEERKVRFLVANLSVVGLGPALPAALNDHARRLDRRVGDWARQESVPFLSLLPAIAEGWKRYSVPEMVIEDDGHPTPKTHGIIAKALFPWLLEELHLGNLTQTAKTMH